MADHHDVQRARANAQRLFLDGRHWQTGRWRVSRWGRRRLATYSKYNWQPVENQVFLAASSVNRDRRRVLVSSRKYRTEDRGR